jgi:hypothetical protein
MTDAVLRWLRGQKAVMEAAKKDIINRQLSLGLLCTTAARINNVSDLIKTREEELKP